MTRPWTGTSAAAADVATGTLDYEKRQAMAEGFGITDKLDIATDFENDVWEATFIRIAGRKEFRALTQANGPRATGSETGKMNVLVPHFKTNQLTTVH